MEKTHIEQQFNKAYLENFSRLKRFACEYVVSPADAENILHDVFLMLWERRFELFTDEDLTGYLLVSTRNKCIDLIRKRMRELEAGKELQEEYFITLKTNLDSLEALNQHQLYSNDIDKIVNEAISKLPEKCRKIFVMSKIQKKKQKEIAQELNITVNTVETQMGIAYKKLKEILNDKFILAILLYF